MKKAALTATFLFLIFPSLVLAKTTVVTSDSSVEVSVQNRVNTSSPVKQQIHKEIHVDGDRVVAQREEVKNKISAARRDRIRSYFSRAVTRIEALISRFETLISRIETRITKINEEDPTLETTSAEKGITDAKTAISSAQSKLETAKTELENTLSSDDPQDSFSSVVETMRGIRDNLKEAHRLLVQVIGDLKGLRVGQYEE